MHYTLKILKIEIITLVYLKLDKIVPYFTTVTVLRWHVQR